MGKNKKIWKDTLVEKPEGTDKVLVLTSRGGVRTAYYDHYRNQWYIDSAMLDESVVQWASMQDLLAVE